jgi:succinate dehydrogenase / fumarate reductase flavoprotein subunit
LNQKLPEIVSFIKTYLGIDPSVTPVPVAPTCHYMMGGIPTDFNGQVLSDCNGSILPGLFAVGECACVSVHGANRLGCNSLIDLVVFGYRTGISAVNHAKLKELQSLPQQAESIVMAKINGLVDSKGVERVPVLREEMQSLMTCNCSVFRNGENLQEALIKIQQLKQRCLNLRLANKSFVFDCELQEALELSNMLRVAEVIIYSAIQRKESRGAHFRSDYPERNDDQYLKHTFVSETPAGLTVSYKPVTIGRFTPEKRRY